MAYTTINIDTRQIERLAKELKGFEKEVAEATYHALNRTVDHVFAQVGKIVPKSYAIKKKDVTETLKKNKPSRSSLEASVTSTGHRLSFAHFPYTPKTPRRKTVMVQIKKSKGKIPSKKGFVATTGAKDPDKIPYNVFKRLGKGRLPIAPIRTLSVPQMITNEKVGEQVQQSAQAMLEQRLDHEITRIMTSMNKEIRRS
ncbi:phage tail protein [Clostridium thermosuccinogenes]|uniref:phage tail protein n=1 Tax=Clostridium thermosuccinogenes TaxID=84032 RepID=UPI000CCC7DC6|nr:phage tail protein [Pseudoclostridium thermosuccinogenes]PNT91287.1 hypothetical protein CDQ83_15910 [Pseudoclostridium thermosuccinogenes]